jgi:HEAT repeat protein
MRTLSTPRTLVLLLCLGLCLGSSCPCLAADPPTWEGRPVAGWVTDLAASDAHVRWKAARELLSFLLEEPTLEVDVRRAIAAGLIAATSDAEEDVRAAATDALQLAGRSSTAAAPALVARLSDPSTLVQGAAIRALVHVPWADAKPASALIARLKGPPVPEWDEMSGIIDALASHPAQAALILSALVEMLKPSPDGNRYAALVVLASAATVDARAADAIVTALQASPAPASDDEDWGHIHRSDRPPVEVAVRLVDDPRWTRRAMGTLRVADPVLLRPLRDLLVRRLGRMADPPEVIDELVRTAFDEDDALLRASAEVWLADPATVVVGLPFAAPEQLMAFFKDPTFRHRGRALRELRRAGAPEVFHPLALEAMSDGDARVRTAAAWVLGTPPLTDTAIDAISRAYRDPSASVRAEVIATWRSLVSYDVDGLVEGLARRVRDTKLHLPLRVRSLRWLAVPAILMGHAEARAAIEFGAQADDPDLQALAKAMLVPLPEPTER